MLLVGDGVELGFVTGTATGGETVVTGTCFCGDGVRLWSVVNPVETV